MKTIAWLSLVILGTGLFTFLVELEDNRASTASLSAKQTIRVGATVPLAGDFAEYGAHIRQGVELAVQDLGTQGITVEPFFEDACLAAQTRRAVSKLVTHSKIDALVANFCIIGILPSAEILERHSVISFQSSVVPKAFLNSGDYLFTTNATIQSEAERTAEYAVAELGLKRSAVLNIETQWGEEFAQSFAAKLTKLGGEITRSESHKIGESDFRAALVRIKASSPDVIFIAHLGAPLGILLKQIRELGMTQPVLLVDEAEEQAVLEFANSAAEGATLFSPTMNDRETKTFDTRFKAHYNVEPHPLSRHAYDATIISALALKECGMDRECAKDKIYKVRDYSGASGRFSINSDGGTKRDFAKIQVLKRAFKRESW